MFTLKMLLLKHHGLINRILLSYSTADSPSKNDEEYEKWYNEMNQDFCVDMDLLHSSQELEQFKELYPYLNLKVNCWDLFKKEDEIILEVDLE